MIKRIVFFNGHQNGDVANSRGVVEYITKHLGENYEYYFLTLRTELGKSGAITFGENIIIHNPIVQGLLPFMPQGWNPDIKTAHERGEIYFMYEDTIFLNVWMGACTWFKEHRPEKGGITRKSLQHQIYECIEVIKQVIDVDIPYPTEIESLSPRTTSPKNKNLVDAFTPTLKNTFQKSILICNGPVMSDQTPQFSFGEILKDIIYNSPDTAFLFTDKNFNNTAYNCFFTDDLFPIPNLSEIDYLSKDINIIVSRMSGPGIITMNRENYLDNSKTLISFTTDPNIAFEALGSDEEIELESWGIEGGAKLIWSRDMNPESITNIIKQAIDEIN
jgi:hypothetical protein